MKGIDFTLSIEALKQVITAEEDAYIEKLEIEKKAQLAIDETIKSGEESIAATLARAEVESIHFQRAADQKATDEARDKASRTANRQAMLRAKAERLLDTATNYIYERIVNG